jgi:hypothetical protein
MDGRESTSETRMEIGTARRKKWKKGKRGEKEKSGGEGEGWGKTKREGRWLGRKGRTRAKGVGARGGCRIAGRGRKEGAEVVESGVSDEGAAEHSGARGRAKGGAAESGRERRDARAAG